MKKLLIIVCSVLLLLAGCGKIADKFFPQPTPAAPPEQPEISPPERTAPSAGMETLPPPQEPETENPDVSPAPVQVEGPVIPSEMLTVYEGVLEEFYQSYEDPERFRYEDGPAFAIYDVNKDGTEELVIKDPTSETLGPFLRIYGYSESIHRAYLELDENSDFCYYDNGVIEVKWSHNQGAAGDKLWPYSVYRYSSKTEDYAYFASVDGWDKELREVFDGQSFPDDLDLDGDGFLYYVITEPGGYAPAYGDAMDYTAYESWRQSYLQGAEPSGFSFEPLMRENISLQ